MRRSSLVIFLKAGGLFCPLLFSISAQALKISSMDMKNFKVQHCTEGFCFEAEGKIGYISRTGSHLVSQNTVLTVTQSGRKMSYQCEAFSFETKSGYAVCDVSSAKRKSIVIYPETKEILRYL